MKIHIKNGRLIDPASGADEKKDVFIAAGKIVAIGAAPAGFTANRTIDATRSGRVPGTGRSLGAPARARVRVHGDA